MDQLGQPDGMVMFASEGLWRQLDALAQWGEGVRDVHLITAYGDNEPGGPEDRLEAFITDSFPGIAVHRHEPIPDDDPPAVVAAVVDPINASAAERDWLVVASGGTRLMFAGAARLADRSERVRVVYCDAEGPPWYELLSGGAIRELAGYDDRAIERFSVASLLNVTWADEERTVRAQHTEIDPEVEAAAAQALADPPSWYTHFTQAVEDTKDRIQGGHVFEQFVMALMRGMGVAADDVAVSAVLYDGILRVQEVDVVVNSRGRLHVIDCKLMDEERALPLSTQIREAYATRRQLGDGGDQYILLRPLQRIAQEFRSLCWEYGIQVVDAEDLERDPLPVVLERLVRPPGVRPRSTPSVPTSVRVYEESGLVDLYAEFVRSGVQVRIYDHRYVLVVTIAKTSTSVKQITAAFEELLEGKGVVVDAVRGANPTNGIVVTVRPFKRQHTAARHLLTTFDVGALRAG